MRRGGENDSDAPTAPGRPLRIAWHDHSSLRPDISRLQSVMERALPQVWAAPGPNPSALTGLEEVEVSLIDDAEIARVHADFLDDPTPTDVITFHHGEILVSLETAAREAAARGEPVLREAALYVIHGMLHLHGHDDADPPARARMHAAQDRILNAVWPRDS